MNEADILNQMLESDTEAAIEGARAFTEYLSNQPVNSRTLYLYLKVLALNDKTVLNAVFAKRTPESIFSPVPPDKNLILSLLNLLSSRRAAETEARVVQACTGTLASIYRHPVSGMKLHPITVQELYHTAKYLILSDEISEGHITEILEGLASLPSGEYGGIAVVAAKIRDASLDKTKSLLSVIPQGLLV